MTTVPPKRYISAMSGEDRQRIKQVSRIRSNIRGAADSLMTLAERVGEDHPLYELALDLRSSLSEPAAHADTMLDLIKEITHVTNS